MSPATSTRWCPTQEQVMILENMYRGGLRTPNASQIQKITAHLSLYGKIEGKNVFYWFQNHKARDRQKLRRKLILQHHHQLQNNHIHACSSNGFQQIPRYNKTHFLFQGGIEEADSQVMNYTQMMNFSEKNEMENSTKMYGCNWMMMNMMDVGLSTTPCCYNYRPLKTLELFPITTTALKDESTQSKNFSFSKSTI